MTSISHRFRFCTRSDYLLGQPHYLWYTPLIWSWYYQMSLSTSLIALISWICASATDAALHLGQNSFASAFNFISSCSLTSLAGTSQWSSNGYNSCIDRTRNFVATCIWTTFTILLSQYTIGIPYQSSRDACS